MEPCVSCFYVIWTSGLNSYIFKLIGFAEEETENELSSSISFCATIQLLFAFVLISLILPPCICFDLYYLTIIEFKSL